jgi:hypothetical protein
MKTIMFSFLFVVAGLAAGADRAAEDELPAIFNGKDLTGWKGAADNPFWKVVDGVLVGENDEKLTGNMLYTEKSYKDLVIECECRFIGYTDSGIMVRKPVIQMQIGISGSLKRDMTCSFYVGKYPPEGQAKNVEKLLKTGDWNKFRLQAKGDDFTVWLNGEQVTEYNDSKYSGEGPIGLQIHPKVKMKVEFRNLRAKALE